MSSSSSTKRKSTKNLTRQCVARFIPLPLLPPVNAVYNADVEKPHYSTKRENINLKTMVQIARGKAHPRLALLESLNHIAILNFHYIFLIKASEKMKPSIEDGENVELLLITLKV